MSSAELQQSKSEIRRELLTKRAQRLSEQTAESRTEQAERLTATMFAVPEIHAAVTAGKTVASYLPLPSEPDTTAFNQALMHQGIRLLVPECVIDDEGEPSLAWREPSNSYATSMNNLTKDHRGIPIPDGERVGVGARGLADASCAVLIIPALACTPAGERLGKGAGYYDRLLAEVNKLDIALTTIAIVFSDEILNSVPTEPHDSAVHKVVSV